MVQKLGLALSLPTIKTAAASFDNLYALDFDGSNDYVDFGNGSTFTPNSSGANRGFSISYWAKTTNNRFVTMSKLDSSPAREWQCKIDTSGTVVFEVYGNDDGNIKQTLTTDTSAGSFINVSDGNWHHIVMTFDLTSGSSSLLFYIDNILFSDANGGATYASTGTWAAVINTSAPFRLAADSRGFKGVMDEVSMFDAVLTITNVNDIYNSGKPGDLAGFGFLIGWWRNGDTAGTGAYPTIVDYSTNSNSGTMTNMASGDIVTDVP